MPSLPPLPQPGSLGSPTRSVGPIRDGGYASLTPGTSVRIGGIEQTSFILDHSMTMRLTTLDLGLINPTTVPAIGDLVFVLEPAWQGTVVKVKQSTQQGVAARYYSITASNGAVAYATPAPFGLADVPDNATTYGFDNLSIESSLTTSGVENRGTCTIFQEGLWPGMTFTLTSSLFGKVAAQYTVSNVTITWPKSTTPFYAIEFGDAMVELSVWVAQAASDNLFPIDSTKITDGSVTTPKLAANAVTASKVAAGTITSNEIASGTITTLQLAVPEPGGQNMILNSGFELGDFSATVDTLQTWTLTADFTGSHIRAATNTTEGNSLTMTGATY